MLGITTSHFTRSAAPPSTPSLTSFSNKSGSGFQPVAPGDMAGQTTAIVLRSTNLSTASPSLGAQTVSTLLQTQEVDQTPIHAGHGGGGGHHGSQMTSSVEAQAAEESEEAQMLNRRKKLLKEMQADKANEASEAGETSPDDVEQNDVDKDGKKAG